jgi:hypothetical protein
MGIIYLYNLSAITKARWLTYLKSSYVTYSYLHAYQLNLVCGEICYLVHP